MAQYRAKQRSFINDGLVEEGDIVSVPDEFPPGEHLEPIDAAAKKAAKDFVPRMMPDDANFYRVMIESQTPKVG